MRVTSRVLSGRGVGVCDQSVVLTERAGAQYGSSPGHSNVTISQKCQQPSVLVTEMTALRKHSDVR